MIDKIKNNVGPVVKSVHGSLKKSFEQAPPEAQKFMKRFLLGAVVLIALIGGSKKYFVYREEKIRAAEIEAGPRVKIATVFQSPGEHTITLQGETRPYQEATLYAKVSGYLKTVKVDKGDVVKEGQVLAVIESPETDQGYEAALADFNNKQAIAERMDKLFQKKLVSQQEIDQARADAKVADARLHTAATLKSYEMIRAPFKSTVTSRFADPGALLQNAMNSQSSALPVVTVSVLEKLRVDVFVDQHDAAYIVKDQPIEITFGNQPGNKIQGQVSRVSGELDPRTKMLLTEIDIDNKKRELVAGSFVQVSLQVKSPPFLEAPVESLVLKDNKSFLTVVTKKNTITFKPVEIGNNDGKMLWISSGVNVGDRVALNVADILPEGGKVRPIEEGTTSP